MKEALNQRLDILWNDAFNRRAADAGIRNPVIRTVDKKPGAKVDVKYDPTSATPPGLTIQIAYMIKEIVGDQVTLLAVPRVTEKGKLVPFVPAELKLRIGAVAHVINEFKIGGAPSTTIKLPPIKIAIVGQSETQLVVATERSDSPRT